MATTLQPLLFDGTLVNQQGEAIPDAKIQLWQTDLDGNYLHINPNAANNQQSPNHAPIVESFQYFGTATSNSNGHFEFLTYRPGIYVQRPYSHFHFMVWLEEPDVEGGAAVQDPDLITQFYFADQSGPFPNVLQLDVMNVDDGGNYNYGSYMNGTIVMSTRSSVDNAGVNFLTASPAQPKGPFYPNINFFAMDHDLTTDETMQSTINPTASPEAIVVAPTPTKGVEPASIAPTKSPKPTSTTMQPAATLSTVSPTPPAQQFSAAAWNFNAHGTLGLWLMIFYVLFCMFKL